MEVYIIILLMFVLALGSLWIFRNNAKVKDNKAKRYTLIIAFRNNYYYDLLSDDRFTSIGQMKKYNDTSFIIKNVTMDDKELRNYICKKLDIEPRNINIVQNRTAFYNKI